MIEVKNLTKTYDREVLKGITYRFQENKIYVIIKEDKEYVWLVDGRLKTISNPKKKRKKHIQPVNYFQDAELCNALMEGMAVSDLQIMMILKKYKKQQMNE